MIINSEGESRNYTTRVLKPQLQHSRFIKELSIEIGTNLGGNPGKRLEDIIDKVDLIRNKLEIDNSNWINRQKRKSRSYLAHLDPNSLDEAYNRRLFMAIKQDYRTTNRISVGELNKFEDPEYLSGLIITFTFDFFRNLHIAERLGFYPSAGLEVAQHAYQHNPSSLIFLSHQYRELSSAIIARALTDYPTQPSVCLEGIIQTVDRLTPLYPHMKPFVIKHAATQYPSNPEKFLDKVMEESARLAQTHPDLPARIITRAVIHNPSNPDTFIEQVKKDIERLTICYPDFTYTAITHAAIHYPSNPSGFLDKLKDESKTLMDKYPDLSPKLITFIIISHPAKPEKFIQDAISNISKLKNLYPDLPPGLIKFTVFRRPSNPEAFIKASVDTIRRLLAFYPKARASDIVEATRRRDPEGFLRRIQTIIDSYKPSFPSLPNYIITMAATSRPASAEKYLTDVSDYIDKLTREYSTFNYPSWVIPFAVAYHISNPREFLNGINRIVADLNQHYPNVTQNIIIHAAVQNPLNPTAYIKRKTEHAIISDEEELQEELLEEDLFEDD